MSMRIRALISAAAISGTLWVLLIWGAAEAFGSYGLAVSDQYWSKNNPCYQKMEITWADDLGYAEDYRTGERKPVDGLATGLGAWWNGSRWVDVLERCVIAVRRGLEPVRKCYVIWHEYSHVVLVQREHTGYLSYDHPGPPDCQKYHRKDRLHHWYHTKSKHPNRKYLAMKWHKLSELE